MGPPGDRESDEPTEPVIESESAAHGDDEKQIPARWTGSAPVPAPAQRRRRRVPRREPTEELPALDDEPWPPPPPPRPANAPVTAPYPPRPPEWTPPPPPSGPRYPVPQYPPGYRRRRRWPWVLAVIVLLVVGCCCCCVSWFRPYAEEYPAAAALPPQAAGLVKLDDPASRAASAKLELQVRARTWLAEDVFAGIYAEPGPEQRRVVIFGATLFVLDPKDRLETAFGELTGELNVTGAREVPAGPAGGYQVCGQGRDGDEAVTVCGWADHGSLAIGVFSGRGGEQSAGLLRELRGAIVTRN